MSNTALKKGVLTALGVSVLAIGYYSYRKYKAAKAIIEKLVILPKSIKDVVISFDTTRFTIGLELFNNSNYDLGFTTGSIIRLKKVKVFTPDGKLLAEIDTNISSLELQAFDSFRLPDMQIEMPTTSLLSQFNNITQYLQQGSLQYDLSMMAFGKEFTIST